MSDSSHLPYSLDPDEIVRRQRRHAELIEQITRLQIELDDINRWFDAASILFPGITRPTFGKVEVLGAPQKQRDWRAIVKPFVMDAPNGLSPKELIEAIENSDDEEAKERLLANPNGHHHGLERLLVWKEAIRHNSRYYEASLFNKLKDSGALVSVHKLDVRDGILKFTIEVVAKGGSMLPKDIMAALREKPEYHRMLSRNPQYGYTVLSRLVKRGLLIRDGAHYKVATDTNEPSDAGTSNGSDDGRPRTLRLV